MPANVSYGVLFMLGMRNIVKYLHFFCCRMRFGCQIGTPFLHDSNSSWWGKTSAHAIIPTQWHHCTSTRVSTRKNWMPPYLWWLQFFLFFPHWVNWILGCRVRLMRPIKSCHFVNLRLPCKTREENQVNIPLILFSETSFLSQKWGGFGCLTNEYSGQVLLSHGY
jgi:hypothetical protein